MQSLHKNWLLVSKTTWEIWTISDKQWKVQKDEIRSATFVQKCIPSCKALNTEDLSNITLNYLCENSPNSLCRFWNHKTFFTTKLLCIFLAQILNTFYTSSPSKCKFSDFALLALKFTKSLMSFLESRVSFSSNFASLFSVMRHNSSVLFHLDLYMFWKKEAHESANF